MDVPVFWHHKLQSLLTHSLYDLFLLQSRQEWDWKLFLCHWAIFSSHLLKQSVKLGVSNHLVFLVHLDSEIHGLKLLTMNDSILSFDKAAVIIVDSLLVLCLSCAHSLLGGDSFEWGVVIFVLIAPELTDETSVLSLFSLTLPAMSINRIHLLLAYSCNNLLWSSFSELLGEVGDVLLLIVNCGLLPNINDPFKVGGWDVYLEFFALILLLLRNLIHLLLVAPAFFNGILSLRVYWLDVLYIMIRNFWNANIIDLLILEEFVAILDSHVGKVVWYFLFGSLYDRVGLLLRYSVSSIGWACFTICGSLCCCLIVCRGCSILVPIGLRYSNV